MGMYTELCLAVEFRKTMPSDIVDVINYMASIDSDGTPPPENLPDHALFGTERWKWMLRSGGSYYFDGQPYLIWKFDEISGSRFLTFGTNIKNYSGEWQEFLDFIAPYVSTRGFIGTLRYEEHLCPTLLYAFRGKIVFQTVEPIKELESL